MIFFSGVRARKNVVWGRDYKCCAISIEYGRTVLSMIEAFMYPLSVLHHLFMSFVMLVRCFLVIFVINPINVR